jgi:hypothetical protein
MVKLGLYGHLDKFGMLYSLPVVQQFNELFDWAWLQPPYSNNSYNWPAYGSTIKAAGKRAILRLNFWDYPGIYPNYQNWSVIRANPAIYDLCVTAMRAQIDNFGAANLYAVSLYEEEPANSLAWATPTAQQKADFIYGVNILYDKMKIAYPNLPIMQNPHVLDYFSAAELQTIKTDMVMSHTYIDSQVTLKAYLQKGLTYANGREFFTLLYAGTGPNLWASEPDYLDKAVNTALSLGITNIGFYCSTDDGTDSGEMIIFNDYPVDNTVSRTNKYQKKQNLLYWLNTYPPLSGIEPAGVMIPLYIYPGAAWDQVIAAKVAHSNVPIVCVINSNSGPGTAYNSTWGTYINKLLAVGIICYGYVWCGETNQFDAYRDCTQDVAHWKAWYPGVTGIFVDGFHGGFAYTGETQVARARAAGYSPVVGNPGMDVAANLLTSVDGACVYETTGLPSVSAMQSLATKHGWARNIFLPYGVAALDTGWVKSAVSYCQWLYVTTDVLPNPWDTIPTYFDALVAALDQGTGTEFRNTGYITEWSTVNLNALNKVKMNLLTHLIFSYITITSATNPTLYSGWGIADTTNRMNQWVTKAHAAGVKISICFYASGTALSSLVANSTLLAQLAQNLRTFAVANNLDGVDIDWESGEPQSEMDTLITAIAPVLHAAGKEITIAGSWYRQDVSLSVFNQHVDFVNLMTYDMYYPPATGRKPSSQTYNDTVTAMNLWANAGYSKAKLGLGISTSALDNTNSNWLYNDIIKALHPPASANSANVTSMANWQGTVLPVSGGVIGWGGIDLARQKTDFALINSFAGIMFFDVGQDSFEAGYSLLEAIIQEEENIMAAYIFQPSQAKTAKLPLNLDASLVGLALTAEVFLSKDGGSTKASTSGKVAFTAASTQNINLPINMPAAAGAYKAYIDILYGNAFFLGFVDVNDILIPGGSVGPIVWT